MVIAASLHPRDLLGSVLALNVSRGSIRWRVIRYAGGVLYLENVITHEPSTADWPSIRAELVANVLTLD